MGETRSENCAHDKAWMLDLHSEQLECETGTWLEQLTEILKKNKNISADLYVVLGGIF